jgi:ATP-dependent helicase Lhr and Lhr-like helicase
MLDSIFHPLVSRWFNKAFGGPSEPQREGWPAIQGGENVLIASPTGSGKTLAAFLCAIDALVKQGLRGELQTRTQVLYVSPLKALANDVQKNLLQPLEAIAAEAAAAGQAFPEIRVLVRSGDTPARERRRMALQPPHILVTTPESLFILLTTESGRNLLKDVRSAIIDEIHALAPDKRGAHLLLSLERLEALAGLPLQRIGLSATQKPVEVMGRFLVGPSRRVHIVDVGHSRPMDLAVEIPRDQLRSVTSGETWGEIYDRLAELIREHETTLVFVNTRRLAERAAHNLGERLGEENVAAHHGSLSREIRLQTERRLKEGSLKVVVATASLELGIDVGAIDLVCQLGSPRSIALALQRIGRSGHWKGAIPKGRIFATTPDELLECAALVRAIRMGDLEHLVVPEAPLDILAQQIVAEAASREWPEEDLFRVIRKSFSYHNLARRDFDEIVALLAEGMATRQGRRGAYLHRDRVRSLIRARRGARLASVTSGGAIPENANYLVKLDPDETLLGTVDEDFAVESMRGDTFLLGNTSWRIRRIEAGVLRVEDARGAPPNFPFWRGEAPGRSHELSQALSELRDFIAGQPPAEAQAWLQEQCGLDRRGAEQAVQYVHAQLRALGRVPTQDRIVAERFFDEGGGMQLVIHAPFGSRINRAWGLALRKRFCRSFNFELQAAATDDGILLSLSDQHSFPLDAVFSFLSSATVRDVLVQALLDAPIFPTRWRWNASRALAVLRFSGGKRVPPFLQRIRSDDLLASVFPEQAACLENIQGDIQIPEHPLVQQTVRDCLTEAMDLPALEQVLERIEEGRISCLAADTREPSPFAQALLNANAYAFLDDAPLEERRARAVYTRRSAVVDEDLEQLSALDSAAVAQVRSEAWPDWRDADEAHDALLTLVLLPEAEIGRGEDPSLSEDPFRLFLQLQVDGRAHRFGLPDTERRYWVAAERSVLARLLYPDARFEGPGPRDDEAFLWERDRALDRAGACREVIRARLESTGPATASELVDILSLPQGDVEIALHALEGEGEILQGRFQSPSLPGKEPEWCNRRLLARIHRLTLGRLRREIEPVTPADFVRFLMRWQRVAEGTRLHGEKGLSLVLDQLQGFEAASAAWELFLLARRVDGYQPEWLDQLCLSGQFSWARLSPPNDARDSEDTRAVRPTRLAPVAFFHRLQMEEFFLLRDAFNRREPGQAPAPRLSHRAAAVLEQLQARGALFFDDLVRLTRRLPVEVDEGLWELVSAGLIAADGFDNLRGLIDPRRRRGPVLVKGKRRAAPAGKSRGRWTLLAPPSIDSLKDPAPPDLEALARQFLKRWGVVFRDLLSRESLNPPWRELLMVYRRLEARGQIRGGRFVGGFTGEQFALPEAVEALRSVRRSEPTGRIIRVSASDPLNVLGILLPGARVRAHPETIIEISDTSPLQAAPAENQRAVGFHP